MRGIICWIMGLILVGAACYQFEIMELCRNSYHTSALGKQAFLPTIFTNATDGLLDFDDLLCSPRDPAQRDMQVSQAPRYCLQTVLPQAYSRLACDFEAHSYCSQYTCCFWIESIELFVKAQTRSTEAAAKDPELSLKIVNQMLYLVEFEFSIMLGESKDSITHTGYPDYKQERYALVKAVQASAVLTWHCDETRTRALQPREASWGTTLGLIKKMERRLRDYGAQVRCWGKRVNLPTSLHCDEISSTLDTLHMLIREFQRRVSSGSSQCLTRRSPHMAEEL
ncbi:hypothetical protein HBH98_172420 [Parastagonospora nodorum]|nr:hypothetical protein HBH53_245120 [Parastagonospora nodorum]KAH3961624.1 hypothetical protein HBH51_180320 [Parastagonospora nodorum]KAH4012817.1 hypothetical protein HBI09_221170 [Parastagonospora nodorum]KAH4163686.1 hypothetical protein HBH43_153820 [Parastagonospora nodorum]KAH4216394.1 hypothetical protein HBI06_231620 [Parastagonospora nodorum]